MGSCRDDRKVGDVGGRLDGRRAKEGACCGRDVDGDAHHRLVGEFRGGDDVGEDGNGAKQGPNREFKRDWHHVWGGG